jgi:glycosyltransferase involved in cell wall biosynthesis
MRLLYLADQVPNVDPAAGDGSALISYNLITSFSDDVEIDLLTFRWGPELPAVIEERVQSVTYLPLRPVRSALPRAAARAADIPAEQRRTSAGMRAFLAHQRGADVTLVHGPFLIGFAARSQGPTLFQAIDPGSFTLAHEARTAGSRPLAVYRRLKVARRLRRERALPEYVSLAVVNEGDAAAWSRSLGRPVLTLPNGVNMSKADSVQTDAVPTVCFVGSLNFGPNAASAKEVVNSVAPLVWERLPAARFLIAGRAPGADVLALSGSRVEVLGDVPDVSAVLARAHVGLFPDQFGLGTRNCVSEALAAGLPVVASEVAARGQHPSPLLHVGASAEQLAELVIEQLSAVMSASAVQRQPLGGVRTWQQAAVDYERALDALLGTSVDRVDR